MPGELHAPKDVNFEKQPTIEKTTQDPQKITIKDIPKPNIQAHITPTTVKQEFIVVPRMFSKINIQTFSPSGGGFTDELSTKTDYDTRWWYDKNKVTPDEKQRVSGIVQDVSLTGGTYEVKETENGLETKVQGYQAKTYGEHENVLGEKPKDGTYEADHIGNFATLSYSPYMEFGKDVTVNFQVGRGKGDNPASLVAIESGNNFHEKTNDYSIEAYEKLGKIDHEKAEKLKKQNSL